MTQIVTFINELAHVTWPAFIIAFWITLGLGVLWAIIQTARNGYQAMKARFTIKTETKYHIATVLCTAGILALLSYIVLEFVKSVS